MVRVENGRVVSESAARSRLRMSFIDRIAQIFWSVVSFVVLFFQTIFSPANTTKPVGRSQQRPVRRLGPGGGGMGAFGGG